MPDDSNQNIIAFIRRDEDGREIIAVCNFAPVLRKEYRIGVERAGVYKEILSSDAEIYGGAGNHNEPVKAEKKPMHGQDYSIALTLPPMSTVFFGTPLKRKAPQEIKGSHSAEKKAVKK